MFEEFIKTHKPENPEQPTRDSIEADKKAVFARINAENAADGKAFGNAKKADLYSEDEDIEIPIPIQNSEKKTSPLTYILPIATAAVIAITAVVTANVFGRQPIVVDIDKDPAAQGSISASSADKPQSSSPAEISSNESSAADNSSSDNKPDETSTDDNKPAETSVDDSKPAETSFDDGKLDDISSETSPIYNGRVEYRAEYIRVFGPLGDGSTKWTLISDTSQLRSYYGSLPTSPADTLDPEGRYTEEFFETNDLLMIELTESSGSIGHRVTDVSYYGDSGTLDVAIERSVPEIGTADMAKWCLIIEIGTKVSPETVHIGFQDVRDAGTQELPTLGEIASMSFEEAKAALDGFTVADMLEAWGDSDEYFDETKESQAGYVWYFSETKYIAVSCAPDGNRVVELKLYDTRG